MRRLIWENNPSIHWWIENDPIRFYYGVELEDILHIRDIRSRVIRLALEPNTPLLDTLIVLEIPPGWMMDHMDQMLTGNSSESKNRLLDKDLYIKWKQSDHLYYKDCHINIANVVPQRYIQGFIIRG